jgi:hypothetical protein
MGKLAYATPFQGKIDMSDHECSISMKCKLLKSQRLGGYQSKNEILPEKKSASSSNICSCDTRKGYIMFHGASDCQF